jgi:hypothetical protein
MILSQPLRRDFDALVVRYLTAPPNLVALPVRSARGAVPVVRFHVHGPLLVGFIGVKFLDWEIDGGSGGVDSETAIGVGVLGGRLGGIFWTIATG